MTEGDHPGGSDRVGAGAAGEAGAGLAALEARIRHDLECLQELPENWVQPRGGADGTPLRDVVVIGAGMAGIATGIALLRRGIRNFVIYDRAPEGREGPWVTYARMRTLRSPKQLAGPAVGLPGLTFRAWYEAQFGAAGWEALGKIPRPQWMEYLDWLRRVMALPVVNGTALVDLDGDAEGVTLTLEDAAGRRVERARRVILANGRDGLGGPYVPPALAGLPARHAVHSSAPIDFTALAGKTVGVIGASASAVDNTAEALEAGAGRVVMLVRRPDIPRVNKSLAAGYPGFALGFRSLPPEAKLEINHYMNDVGVPPPRHSVLRCTAHPQFAIHTDCPVSAARVEDGRVVLDTGHGEMRVDFLIFGTGFCIDWAQRPELARLGAGVQLWSDQMPEAGLDAQTAQHPVLGPDMAFRPRAGADWVSRVQCMNNAAMMSHGRIAGDIPAISVGAMRIADALTESFFAEDWETHYADVRACAKPEIRGDEWTVEAPSPAPVVGPDLETAPVIPGLPF